MAEGGQLLDQIASKGQQRSHAVDARPRRPDGTLRKRRDRKAENAQTARTAFGQELQDVTLKRAELLHGAVTGAPVEQKTRWGVFEDRVRGEQGTEVVVKAETVKKISDLSGR